jgi:Tfp pilus assembly protein PilF
MASQWFYQVMGVEVGPISDAELRNLAQRGAVSRDTLVKNAPDASWVLADRVKGLFPVLDGTPPPIAVAVSTPVKAQPTDFPPAPNRGCPDEASVTTGCPPPQPRQPPPQPQPPALPPMPEQPGQAKTPGQVLDAALAAATRFAKAFARGWASLGHWGRLLVVNGGLVAIALLAFFIGGFSHKPGEVTRSTAVWPSPPEERDEHMERGEEAARKGDWDLATAEFTTVIQLHPQNARAFVRRGTVYCCTGHYSWAIDDCTRAIQLDPNAADAYSVRGCAYVAQNEWSKAFVSHNEAVRLAPDSAKAHYLRGLADEAYGDALNHWSAAEDKQPSKVFRLALLDHNEAVRLDPSDEDAKRHRKDLEELLKQFQRIGAERPKPPWPYLRGHYIFPR